MAEREKTCFFAGVTLDTEIGVLDSVIELIEKERLPRGFLSSMGSYAAEKLAEITEVGNTTCYVDSAIVDKAKSVKAAVRDDNLDGAKRVLRDLKETLWARHFELAYK